MHEPDFERRFGGLRRLYGDQALDTLKNATVLVAGIGGVGSWTAEALARTAVGHLILADLDHIAESNVNRQIHALSSTIGKSKVEATADRLRQINPGIQLTLIDDFVDAGNVAEIFSQRPLSLVIDCSDQVQAKVAMLLEARKQKLDFLMCGGAGGKTQSLGMQFSDLSAVRNDALLSKIRNLLRRNHGFPKAADKYGKALKKVPRMHVNCLWIDEKAVLPWGQQEAESGAASGPQGLSCAGYGSAVAVTAAMGMEAANQAILRLIDK